MDELISRFVDKCCNELSYKRACAIRCVHTNQLNNNSLYPIWNKKWNEHLNKIEESL